MGGEFTYQPKWDPIGFDQPPHFGQRQPDAYSLSLSPAAGAEASGSHAPARPGPVRFDAIWGPQVQLFP